ncbi:Zinc finger RING-type [Arabidopsis thaliana x Arabidopsis arenosa]|uniref:RING-type E3 ubiquitin transferase n=1 Tax=Arabidopsis thaliana x Arabidopsis arenosa TaxID=1240361 RepID=A0A8T1YVQ6_9BRAS|nr:Zinc finger RING-type [Arabidopsis thaliana x Arabidopsis arenosa]KAG7550213.1 Zinc finger RING-type [Arabidopsis thaliana x Arabidopsis arenosa]
MDGCAGKRSVDRLVVPRKASGLILRDNMNKTDGKTVPFCSRVGCSAKVTSTKRSRIGSTDNNTKVALPPVPSSSHGKEIAGSSSRTPGGFGYLRKPAKVTARRQPSSSLDTESSEKSSIHDDPAATEPTFPRQKTKRGTINVHPQSAVSGEVVLTKAGSSSRGTSRISHQKSELGSGDALTGPSVSTSSDNSEHTIRGGLSRNRLRNLRCNSVSDVLPTNSNSATKISVTKKKNSDGESSSSSKGSKTSLLVPKVRSQNSSHGNGITVSDNRRNRIVPSIRDSSVGSSGGRRSGYIGRSERLGAVASSATSRQMPHPATPTDPNPSLSFFPSDRYSRPNSSTGRVHSTMPGSPTEADPSSSLVNRDGLSHYNMNGIAEVLLALERIEHDEELTYEQLASLETNLFSSGMFRFYDQHRDMRLDIDNMSYEELLALGEKIGTVSTALSEEALSRSLKQSTYQETDETGSISLNKEDDIKCSICQEEYVDGDEVGTMPCQHMYHVSCVQQWLRMKNWCPICKTSAEEEKSF